MKHSIGDDQNNLSLLRSLREDLVGKDEKQKEDAKWAAFEEAVEGIACACGKRNLGELASNVRRIKNLLRRPSVRKSLAQMEGEGNKEDNGKSEKPTGACKCAKCGKVVDGSTEPCAKGALCIDCGMKSREAPPDEKENKKDEKKAKKSTAFPPEMMGQGGGGKNDNTAPAGEPEEQPIDKAAKEKEPTRVSSLRRKKTKKKDKEAMPKGMDRSKKKMRAEGKLRCRNYRMASVFEDID